ncbi:hypothetical protein M885DRAFT_512864, partial [Pelagophyceae sp. CCMP2097]
MGAKWSAEAVQASEAARCDENKRAHRHHGKRRHPSPTSVVDFPPPPPAACGARRPALRSPAAQPEQKRLARAPDAPPTAADAAAALLGVAGDTATSPSSAGCDVADALRRAQRRQGVRRRCVSFHHDVRVKRCEMLSHLPDDRKAEIWHRPEDYKRMVREELVRRRGLGITSMSIILPSKVAWASVDGDDADAPATPMRDDDGADSAPPTPQKTPPATPPRAARAVSDVDDDAPPKPPTRPPTPRAVSPDPPRPAACAKGLLGDMLRGAPTGGADAGAPTIAAILSI